VMDSAQKETLELALEIFNALLMGEEVSRSYNKNLYESFLYNVDIEETVLFIAEKFDMELYRYNDKLYLCPGVKNQLFGYTNEELRKKIARVNKNSNDELYLCYFIIMVIITMFYKESNMDTYVNYIKLADLIEEVSSKFDALINMEDLEQAGEEYSYDFPRIARAWMTLKDGREEIGLGGKNDKVSFVRMVCQFLQEEKLLTFDGDRNLYFPTDRFKAIIYNYFENRENKNDLYEFVYRLGRED